MPPAFVVGSGSSQDTEAMDGIVALRTQDEAVVPLIVSRVSKEAYIVGEGGRKQPNAVVNIMYWRCYPKRQHIAGGTAVEPRELCRTSTSGGQGPPRAR